MDTEPCKEELDQYKKDREEWERLELRGNLPPEDKAIPDDKDVYPDPSYDEQSDQIEKGTPNVDRAKERMEKSLAKFDDCIKASKQ